MPMRKGQAGKGAGNRKKDEVVKLVEAQLDFPIAKGGLMQEPEWKLKLEGRTQNRTRL